MEVNEKIVYTWLVANNYFVMDNVDYGKYHRDIDLLAVNLSKKEILDCEVKIRTGSTRISDSNTSQEGFNHFIDQLCSEERDSKIAEITGSNNKFKIKKVFITTYSFLGKEKNRQSWIDKFNKFNIEVRFIEDIVTNLDDISKDLSKSQNEVIQILRLLNIRNQRENR